MGIELSALLQALMIYSNLGIAGGYCCAAAFTMPGTDVVWRKLRIIYRQTRWCGTVFLLSCAATHLELFLHARTGGITLEDMTSWHMVAIHVVQMFAVFGFLLGILREVSRPDQTPVPTRQENP